MRYLTILTLLLISVGICSAELPPPPALNDTETKTQLQQYLENLYTNHNVLSIVTTAPDGSRRGAVGDTVIYNNTIWYNSDGATTWVSAGINGVTADSPLIGSGTTASHLTIGGISSFGASGQVMVANATGDGLLWNTPSSGGIVQEKYYQSQVGTFTATNIPNDNTIPQIGEGVEWATLAFTPKSATDILEIDVNLIVSCSAAGQPAIVALFDTSVDANNALAANGIIVVTIDYYYPLSIKYFRVAGNTNLRTFRVRYGRSSSGNLYINDNSGGTFDLGNTRTSTISIKEFTP